MKIREEDIPELKIQKNNIKILEFPIKNLFEKNVSYIEFIHKTIFEYFLSEYIFMLFIQEVLNKITYGEYENDQDKKEMEWYEKQKNKATT